MRNQKMESSIQEVLEKNHVVRPPVPVELIAQAEGIEVREAPTGTNISGALVRSRGAVFIAVNNAHHPNRRRFTVAHELAHHFLRHSGTDYHVDGDFTINLRDQSSSEGTNLNEIQANRFASALLMPKKFLFKDLPDLLPLDEEKVRKLARRYQVSEQ